LGYPSCPCLPSHHYAQYAEDGLVVRIKYTLVLSVDPLIQEATYECRSTSGRDRPGKLREWM